MHPARPSVSAFARPTYRLFSLVIVAAVLAAACGSGTGSPAAQASGVASSATAQAQASSSSPVPGNNAAPSVEPSEAASAAARSSPSGGTSPGAAGPDQTTWLCKPGLADNPCAGNLDRTTIDGSGKSSVEKRSVAQDAPVDCFYVYPTVSRQATVNANLRIDPEERAVALAQAAQFSSVCRVYAPMYRQLTSKAIADTGSINLAAALTAYGDVAAAFASYLAHYNGGRPIVFIGHSQGSMLLIELLRSQVDPNPDVRQLLVSALLMGGNVKVPNGKVVGGDFQHIPACQSSGQTGCVVGYSTFDRTPPADAVFGRANSGLGPLSDPDPNMRVLCVNPAAPSGGIGSLTPVYPTSGISPLVGAAATPRAGTPFVAYPGQYTGECRTSGDRTWLQVTRTGGSGDPRPPVRLQQLATWGLHVVDVNIALGNLVELVRSESAAFK